MKFLVVPEWAKGVDDRTGVNALQSKGMALLPGDAETGKSTSMNIVMNEVMLIFKRPVVDICVLEYGIYW